MQMTDEKATSVRASISLPPDIYRMLGDFALAKEAPLLRKPA